MNRTVLAGSFAAGLAVVVWVAWGFVGVNALALGMTGLIAGVYLLGGWELWRYRAQTAVLDAALSLGTRAAAITVSRAGANPPWSYEL